MTETLSVAKTPTTTETPKKGATGLRVYVFNADGYTFGGTISAYIREFCDGYARPIPRTLRGVVEDANDRWSDILISYGPLTPTQISVAAHTLADDGDCWRVCSLKPFKIEQVDTDEANWWLEAKCPPVGLHDVAVQDVEDFDEDDGMLNDDAKAWIKDHPLATATILGTFAACLLILVTGAGPVIFGGLATWAIGLWTLLCMALWPIVVMICIALGIWFLFTDEGRALLAAILALALVIGVIWGATYGLWSLGKSVQAKNAAAHFLHEKPTK